MIPSKLLSTARQAFAACALSAGVAGPWASHAGGHPTPVEGEWTVTDFRFHDGTVLLALKLHYKTVGSPKGKPVLFLHGTAGSSNRVLSPGLAGELFGPGQPLDANHHFIILPDAIGTGQSSKPSDGLRTRFPAYNCDDMVHAQYRLITEHLKIPRLRLVMGNSMGGMQTWLWGIHYPDFMDALVPMASLPSAMAGRNWIMRRMLIDGIQNDPDYADGHYTEQPPGVVKTLAWFNLLTSGGNLALMQQAPTSAQADVLIARRLQETRPADANDLLFQWRSSRDYDPAPMLDRIRAPVLAINAADDERNPVELDVLEKAIATLPRARSYIIPPSADTRGHGTTGNARHYTRQLAEFLRETEPDGARPSR
jgi:homoserine O-acetyltransferase